LSLSEHATAENIIDKLDGVYGNVYSSEALLENLFKETQQPNQSFQTSKEVSLFSSPENIGNLGF
jgi:hypothetical protein